MFFEAGGDPSEVLDPVEEALDAVALAVESLAKAVAVPSVRPMRDVGRALFIETGRLAIAVLVSNVGWLGEDERAKVKCATRPAPTASDLALLDAPYRSRLAVPALAALAARVYGAAAFAFLRWKGG